jgi:AcrR family transcriptional regulator
VTKDERHAAKRARILAGARRLMAERGYRGFTMADLAELLAVSIGSLYIYFPSDLDIYAALLREDLERNAMPDYRARVVRRYMPAPMADVLGEFEFGEEPAVAFGAVLS